MWVMPQASAEFVCQMEQVLDVYQRPYDEQHPVVCLDESPKQLISESRAPIKAATAPPCMTASTCAMAWYSFTCSLNPWQASEQFS